MRHFSLVAFLGSIPQAQMFSELESYFVDPVVIGEDKYSLGCPSSSLVPSLFFVSLLFPFHQQYGNVPFSCVLWELASKLRRLNSFWIRTCPSVSIVSLWDMEQADSDTDLFWYCTHCISLKILSVLTEGRQWKKNFLHSEQWIPELKIINYLHVASDEGRKDQTLYPFLSIPKQKN